MTIVGKKLEPKQIEDNEDQLIFYPIITIKGNNNVDPKAESINQQTVNLRYEYFVVVTTQRTHTHTHTHTCRNIAPNIDKTSQQITSTSESAR